MNTDVLRFMIFAIVFITIVLLIVVWLYRGTKRVRSEYEVLQALHEHKIPIMPTAEQQGDEVVIVNPEALGERDANGRFKRIPTLHEVLNASSYNKVWRDSK